jgi:hypothetical protein
VTLIRALMRLDRVARASGAQSVHRRIRVFRRNHYRRLCFSQLAKIYSTSVRRSLDRIKHFDSNATTRKNAAHPSGH